MVPHSWIVATMGMVNLSDNIIGLIKQSMNKWKTRNECSKSELPALHGRLKVVWKNDKKIDSLIKIVWKWSKDIKMELGILKCVVVLL